MIANRRNAGAAAIRLALFVSALLCGPRVGRAADSVGALTPALNIDSSQTGQRLQVNFPNGAYGDPNHLLYRLNGGEDVLLDVQVFAGRDEVGFPIELGATLLVDGQQAVFRARLKAPGKTARFELRAPREVVRSTLSLEGRRLSPGVHSVDLLLWRADGVPFPCWSFLLVKGVEGVRTFHASEAFVLKDSGQRPAANFWLSSSTEPLFGPLRRTAPPALESLVLRAHLERSQHDGEPLELGVAALLDGDQVSLSSSGRSPTLQLRSGEAADAELRVRGLPAQSTGHHLVFFLLRRPSLTSREDFLAIRFSPTRQVGGLAW